MRVGRVYKIAKATHSFVLSLSVCPSVCPSAQNNSAPTGRIFMNLDSVFFQKTVYKLQVSSKYDKINWCFT